MRGQTIDRINDNTITIVAGDIYSTSAKLTQDLAVMLYAGEKQRVLPVLGLDSVLGVSDVLHLYGVDIGIVHEDSLEMIGQDGVIPDVNGRVHYIAKLSRDNIYIIADNSITDINQLAGKTVNFGPGSDNPNTTPALLFKALGIEVKPTNMHQEQAIELIGSGEIAATVIVGGRLDEIAAKYRATDSVRLLPIPLPANSTVYAPATIISEETSAILPADSSLDTVSVALIMIVNNWPQSHKRYPKAARFVETFFGKFDDLRQNGHMPQWKEVDLAATLPNWTRFAPAQNWLDSVSDNDPSALVEIRERFGDFLVKNTASIASGLTSEQKDQVFQEFLSWPQNRVEAKITVRWTSDNGVGKVIGTITAMNSETMVGGRKEPALLLKPDLKGLSPGPHAFHIHQKPECGAAEKDGKMVAGMGAGGHLWLSGTGQFSGTTFSSHLGDLPDLQVDADGTATKEIVVARLTLADTVNRTVMLHASDDAASPRMACGVVQ